MRGKIRFLFIIPVLFLLLSCEKEVRSSIPDCDVYIKTNKSEYTRLSTVNSAVTYTIDGGGSIPVNFRYGYGGVVIYRDLDEKIRSYDLACPVEALPTIRVKIQTPFAVCPQCGSKFDLNAIGTPVSGPSKLPLHLYTHAYEYNGEIIVTN